MIEQTLVLVKPDGVARSLTGRIIQRFEDAGLKIIGLKMHWADSAFAAKHYTEDLAKRRGEKVRNTMIKFLSEGPVVAIALEGIAAIEIVRKMVGDTEPRAALPGTIRGDFAHVSYQYSDTNNIPVRNIIHASGNKADAEYEVKLWFTDAELHHKYKAAHELHTR